MRLPRAANPAAARGKVHTVVHTGMYQLLALSHCKQGSRSFGPPQATTISLPAIAGRSPNLESHPLSITELLINLLSQVTKQSTAQL